MATLKDEHKLFIVQRFAMHDTPSMISKALKEEFGIDLPRNQVANYDVDKVPHRVSAKLRAVFAATRKAWEDDIATIPIANRSYRLRRLQMMHDNFMHSKNYVAAANMLEQAAKEAGDVFTNSVKVKGNVKHDHEHEVALKVDEQRATLADLVEQALRETAPKTTH